MATMELKYPGELRTESVHLASGNKIITDAPIDNHGKGEAFSPTDLLCSAFGSCMLTIMGIAANTHGLQIDGTTLTITKIMASNPRRVQEIVAEFTMPHNDYSEKDRALLENAARTCPVARSLHPDLVQTIRFHY
jgi:putative redox protein